MDSLDLSDEDNQCSEGGYSQRVNQFSQRGEGDPVVSLLKGSKNLTKTINMVDQGFFFFFLHFFVFLTEKYISIHLMLDSWLTDNILKPLFMLSGHFSFDLKKIYTFVICLFVITTNFVSAVPHCLTS